MTHTYTDTYTDTDTDKYTDTHTMYTLRHLLKMQPSSLNSESVLPEAAG